ncbi:LAGLIDADG family homing endonuclease [Halomonas sp. IOP_31]|uniref:LAGLIDADG family homing endonuclease n=1 Tax=Halomonas sp. IOP_31 TaxID=2876584 RepID=UPI001E570A12|nr:hypothetical protein [Halomonas sp. IOP_31]MCD6006905.1 hypothetical protein [Halomonas sp. IOP_31]
MATPDSSTALFDGILTADELAYMAGMIDAEGCIAIGRDRYKVTPWHRLQVSVANTDQRLMTWLTERFGGFVCSVKRHKVEHKHGYQWYITQEGAASLTRALAPYLVIKRAQAELAVSFIVDRKQLPARPEEGHPELTRRESCYEHMKSLNRKGFSNRANVTPTRGKLLPSHSDLAYMAGMVDGDGPIILGKTRKRRASGTIFPKHELKLVVTNTSPTLIEWLFSRFGGTCVTSHGNASWKEKLDWKLNGGRAAEVLKLIGPHLRMKGEQGRIAQAFITDMVKLKRGSDEEHVAAEIERREALYQRMRALNQCGNAAATTKHQAPAALLGESIV